MASQQIYPDLPSLPGCVHSGSGPVPTGLPRPAAPVVPPVVVVNQGDSLALPEKAPAANG